MNNLNILLPFGLPPVELERDLAYNLKLPSLAKLITRTKNVFRQKNNSFSRTLPHEIWLTSHFSLPKIISSEIEWKRVRGIIKKFKKKFPKIILSIDTRKSLVMKNAIKYNAEIINDVSCFHHDINSLKIIKNKNLWKVIHHMQGTPQTMQMNPKYNNAIIDIYDFFEKEIIKMKKNKYSNKIILDPGIGFGKNLKHNLMIMNKISLFHSLGFPILIGTSRKKFISQISKNYDSKERLGGTLSSVLFSLLQGVKIFRVHNVREIKQGILVFETLLNK